MRAKNPSNVRMVNGVLTDKYGRTFELDWKSIEKTKKSNKTATIQNSIILKTKNMATPIQKLPDWFKGQLYEEGKEIFNPFTKEGCYLTNVELSMYDFLNGCSILTDNEITLPDIIINDWKKGLDWFRETNYEAYMILVD